MTIAATHDIPLVPDVRPDVRPPTGLAPWADDRGHRRWPPEAAEPTAPLAGGPRGGLFLPPLPRVPGLHSAGRCRPARDGVPGDFVDVFPTGFNEWGVLVGDVCGNGAPAAGMAVAARQTVRRAAGQKHAPGRVLGRLNAAIFSPTPDSERFLTAVYLALRPAQGGVRAVVCSAGHTPVLVRRTNGTVRSVSTGGIALGVTADPQLAERRLLLWPGDTVVLYTDGVTEACRNGERYGEDRLRRLVSRIGDLEPATLARQIENTALRFADGSHHDDVTVLVLRVT